MRYSSVALVFVSPALSLVSRSVIKTGLARANRIPSPPALAWCLVLAVASVCQSQIKTTDYQEDKGGFPNPERGYYVYTDLHKLDARIGRIRNDAHSLVWGKINLEPYRNSRALPKSFLNKISAGFRIARDQGVKVIVRGSYGHKGADGDYTSYEDPPMDHIKNHIQQLAPIFAANTDVIALLEAGFVGPWGEWHGTTIATDYGLGREMLLFVLAHTPSDRMVVVRYPYLKQRIFQLRNRRFAMVNSQNAYSGIPVARVGHHNDCFLSSPTDVGTYDRGGSTRKQETAYLAKETLYTVYGGETCSLHELSDCQRAISELETLHCTYLNHGYHPKVLDKWKRQGCFDEIKRRLGARFLLTQSRVSDSALPGGVLVVECDLKNVGFAPLYNPRAVQIVVKNENTDQLFRFELDVDPRHWKPGQTHVLRERITLPSDMPNGTYAVYLNLPDPYKTLQDDPRYSYRIASKGVWEPETGFNKLTGGIKVDERRRGQRTNGQGQR